MANDQQFCLRWNNHQSTLISVFDSLLENGTLVDCTLAAEGQYLKAHKVVLSACSPYLETLLSQHYEKHPIVILKDVKFTELKSMMDYMYRGEVNISQDQLGTFLKAAESLQIKGLSDNGDEAASTSAAPKNPPATARPSVTQTRTPVESKRPAPINDTSDASRDGSISPSSLRKRRRTRRPSQGEEENHLDSNVCDTAQSTPIVPTVTVPAPVKQIVKQEPNISINDVGLKKEIIDPPTEPLLEPKTEYLDYMNNENSIEVEDLTLDDDDDLDSSMDASRPGPSHGDMSNQGYQWPMSGDQSGTDEIFMAAQEAVGAATQQQRDSQGEGLFTFASCGSTEEIDPLLTSEEDAILPDQQSVSTDEGEELRKILPLPKTFKTPSSEISKSKIGPYPIWSPTSEISKTKKGPYPIWSPKSFVSLQNGKSSRNLCISAPKQFKSQGNANNIGKRPRGRPRINFQVSRNYPISSGGGKARRGRPRIHFSNPSSKTVRVEQSFNSNPLNISKSNIKEVSTAQSLNHTNSTSHLKNEKSFEKPKQRVGQKTESFGNFPSLFEVKERLKSLFSDETALDGATSKDIKNSSTNEEIKLNQSLEKTKLLKSDVKSPIRKSSPEEITFVSCSSSSSTYVRGTVSRNQITPKKDNSELRALLAMGSKVDTPESQAKGTTVEKIPIKKSIAQETEKSPEKRSVGRPRKDNSPVKSLEKKPVGRPRKDNSPAKSPSGRPRGRPKKSEVEIETSPSPTVTQNKVKNKTVVEKIITEPTNIETSEKSKKTPEFSSGVCLKTPNYIPTGRPRGRPRKQAAGRPRKQMSEVDSSSGASATTHDTESC